MLLPHPDGPTSETKVCPSISKLTLVIAVTGSWPLTRGGNTFLTFCATNLAIGLLRGGRSPTRSTVALNEQQRGYCNRSIGKSSGESSRRRSPRAPSR